MENNIDSMIRFRFSNQPTNRLEPQIRIRLKCGIIAYLRSRKSIKKYILCLYLGKVDASATVVASKTTN